MSALSMGSLSGTQADPAPHMWSLKSMTSSLQARCSEFSTYSLCLGAGRKKSRNIHMCQKPSRKIAKWEHHHFLTYELTATTPEMIVDSGWCQERMHSSAAVGSVLCPHRTMCCCPSLQPGSSLCSLPREYCSSWSVGSSVFSPCKSKWSHFPLLCSGNFNILYLITSINTQR